MRILRAFIELFKIVNAVYAGLWIGGMLRQMLTGEPVSIWRHRYVTAKGSKMSNIPVITKFWPAFLLSFFGRPRWFSGLLGGFLAGALVDDSYEDAVLEMIAARMDL